jgi:hypothetical protein
MAIQAVVGLYRIYTRRWCNRRRRYDRCRRRAYRKPSKSIRVGVNALLGKAEQLAWSSLPIKILARCELAARSPVGEDLATT